MKLNKEADEHQKQSLLSFKGSSKHLYLGTKIQPNTQAISENIQLTPNPQIKISKTSQDKHETTSTCLAKPIPNHELSRTKTSHTINLKSIHTLKYSALQTKSKTCPSY